MQRAVFIAAMLAVALPAVARADIVQTQIAQAQGETLVAAYGGWVVWSSYDPIPGGSGCTATRAPCERWRLFGRAPGSQSITLFTVASRPIPFDVDLGPDRRGRPAAVYSRCQREPRTYLGGWRYARHRAGSGCRIVKLDLKTGRESTLYRRKGHSLIYPTLWRNRVAYVARGRRPHDLHIQLRVTRNARTSTTVLGRAPAKKTETPLAGPLRMDLYRKDLVFAWEGEPDACPSPNAGDIDMSATRIFAQRDTQPRKLLDHGCADTTAPAAVLRTDSVTIFAHIISWTRTINRKNTVTSYLRRRSLRTGKTADLPIPHGYYSLAADGRTLYAEANLYKIVHLTLPGFRARLASTPTWAPHEVRGGRPAGRGM